MLSQTGVLLFHLLTYLLFGTGNGSPMATNVVGVLVIIRFSKY